MANSRYSHRVRAEPRKDANDVRDQEQPHAGDMLDTEGLARFLDVPAGTVRSWRARGVGPPGFRLSGKHVRYLRSDVELWLRERRATETLRRT